MWGQQRFSCEQVWEPRRPEDGGDGSSWAGISDVTSHPWSLAQQGCVLLVSPPAAGGGSAPVHRLPGSFPKDAQAHPSGNETHTRVPRPLVSGDRVTRHLEAAGKVFSQETVGLSRQGQPCASLSERASERRGGLPKPTGSLGTIRGTEMRHLRWSGDI